MRESDLRSYADVVGRHRTLHVWPPPELAPGVTLQRRQHVKRNPQTQEPVEVATYLEPVILDSRLYYFNLSEHNARPEDERNCPACNGATYVRHGELTPGRHGFGAFMACPQWRSDAKRCVRVDAMGFEVAR